MLALDRLPFALEPASLLEIVEQWYSVSELTRWPALARSSLSSTPEIAARRMRSRTRRWIMSRRRLITGPRYRGTPSCEALQKRLVLSDQLRRPRDVIKWLAATFILGLSPEGEARSGQAGLQLAAAEPAAERPAQPLPPRSTPSTITTRGSGSPTCVAYASNVSDISNSPSDKRPRIPAYDGPHAACG